VSDDAKKLILERRERFMRAALAGAGLALAACDPSSKTCDSFRRNFPEPVQRAVNCAPAPTPCLSVEIVDGGAPTPCLSAPLQPRDAGHGGKPDGGK
jgi:hypothetical protein